MKFKISKLHFYTDKGYHVERGLTRSWDKYTRYEDEKVDVILISLEDISIRKVITIDKDNFNIDDYQVGTVVDMNYRRPPEPLEPMEKATRTFKLLASTVLTVVAVFLLGLFVPQIFGVSMYHSMLIGFIGVTITVVTFIVTAILSFSKEEPDGY